MNWIKKRFPLFRQARTTHTQSSMARPFVANVSKGEHKKVVNPNKQDYRLSQKAIREISTVLSSFYNYLALEEKVSINPNCLNNGSFYMIRV